MVSERLSRGSEALGEDEQKRHFEVFRLYNWKQDRIRPFKDNEIHTSKYNMLTFLPKNLFYQFRKMSNLFFLSMSLL